MKTLPSCALSFPDISEVVPTTSLMYAWARGMEAPKHPPMNLPKIMLQIFVERPIVMKPAADPKKPRRKKRLRPYLSDSLAVKGIEKMEAN